MNYLVLGNVRFFGAAPNPPPPSAGRLPSSTIQESGPLNALGCNCEHVPVTPQMRREEEPRERSKRARQKWPHDESRRS